MKMPFEWVVGDSSKGLHGDRAHVYDGGGAVTVNYTTLRGTTSAPWNSIASDNDS